MSILLTCPFCGSHAEFEYTEWDGESGDDGMGYVRCANYKCGVNIYGDYESAVEQWNKRVKQPGVFISGKNKIDIDGDCVTVFGRIE